LNDVQWVVNRYSICNLSAKAAEKALITPIDSKTTGHRIYIDLIDFRAQMDGPYCWVIQIKDHFSRYIWLEEMKDKESKTVAGIMEKWMGANGRPIRL
jgi:hypothetical protein